VFVALHIDRNALFNYKNFFPKPEALFDLTLCVGGFDRYVFLFHTDEVSTVCSASKSFLSIALEGSKPAL
jgi:hypothetical protein